MRLDGASGQKLQPPKERAAEILGITRKTLLEKRKEPLTDESHLHNAIARFDQVTGVSDADRALAFANIEKAAKHYDVNLSETSWHDLGVHPQRNREEAAAKGAATRKREERD